MINKKKITQRIPLSDLSSISPPLNPLIRQLYENRGIQSANDIDYRLKHLPRPDLLFGMKDACELLFEALQADANILIVGDYDVDGATSTALSKQALKSFGFKNVAYFIPDRMTFGYGLSPQVVEVIHQYQPDILLTVDNGITSIDGVKFAKDLGMSVIITDHHLPSDVLPQADAIINPNQLSDVFPAKSLAGVGVVFYLMLGLRSYLRQQNWFSKNDIAEPNMVEYLDLVALGTIADVVPFDYVNRSLVSHGLERIRRGKCCEAIKYLSQLANCSLEEITATDIAFKIAPKINAAGRLDDMSIGVECLLNKDINKVSDLADSLNAINEQRKNEETISNEQAAEQISNEVASLKDKQNTSSICLYKTDWHPGIVGLMASRLKDSFNVPSVVFADDSEYLKGSARSVQKIHIRDVFSHIASRHPGLIVKYGGHAMAAGLTIRKKDFDSFKTAYDEQIRTLTNGKIKTSEILSDGSLQSGQFSLDTVTTIQKSGPWGKDFEEPLFDNVFNVINVSPMGKTQTHLRFVLSLKNDENCTLNAVAFNVDRYMDLTMLEMNTIHAAFQLNINRYKNSEKLQMIINYFDVLN